MKRLVYAPQVKAFINSDDGVVDISPYLVRGSVTRKINQVSSAELILRNPISQTTDVASGDIAGKMLWTEHIRSDGSIGPRFFPMDPIIIIMQRIAGYPVQVFTGYLDTAPYLQLFPGLCKLEASCTLKRLLYTQWDAALPFTQTFLTQNGWVLNSDSGLANPTAESKRLQVEANQVKGRFDDGSIGRLLHEVLVHIGNWDTNIIWIEALPPQIKDLVTDLYQQIQPEVKAGDDTFKSMLDQILKTNSQGSGSPTGSPGTPHGSGPRWKVLAGDENVASPTSCGPVRDRGFSVLSTSGVVGDVGTAGEGLTPGTKWPCGQPGALVLTNPANGKSVTETMNDIGAGSQSYHPVINLYPGTKADLGISGNPFQVIVQSTSGKQMNPGHDATPA